MQCKKSSFLVKKWDSLTLSTLGKFFSRRHFEFFSYFPRKQDVTFHGNYLNGDNFHEMSSLSGKNNKTITNLLSAELAQRVVKVKK